MFITVEQTVKTYTKIIKSEISQWSQQARLELLYAAFSRDISGTEAMGFTREDITTIAGLIYFDRKSRLGDLPFPTTHGELAAIFAELDQDPDTQPLLDWLAKNLPRFSRIGLHQPSTATTLKSLMLASGVGLRDRNPTVLRAVMELALTEYLSRNYDRDRLKALLDTLLTDERPGV